MRVELILQRLVKGCRGVVHAVRLQAVVAAAMGAILARRLTVTAVGRALVGRTAPKHSIKRIDRLLSNPRLHGERIALYGTVAAQLLKGIERPVVLVDWTPVGEKLHALAAAVPLNGRAITIYSEVHPEKRLGNRRVQSSFLAQLRRVLPDCARPILVADAGFQAPFIGAVRAMGWDFVIRVRGAGNKRPRYAEDMRAHDITAIYAWAQEQALDLGQWLLSCWTQPGTLCRLVLGPQFRPRRRRHRSKPHTNAEISAAKAAKEPWLLATSLDFGAAEVVRLYATRMQIEETFRDAKDHRFGWALMMGRCGSARRLNCMLLIAALATLAVVFCGLAAESAGLHRRYQANTVRHRVLSFFSLGVAVLMRADPLVPRAVIRDGTRHFRQFTRGLIPAVAS